MLSFGLIVRLFELNRSTRDVGKGKVHTNRRLPVSDGFLPSYSKELAQAGAR
jgi:hypothetical protein